MSPALNSSSSSATKNSGSGTGTTNLPKLTKTIKKKTKATSVAVKQCQDEDSSSSSSDEEKPTNANHNKMEQVYEITYVEDYIEAVNQMQEISQQNTKILQGHSHQLDLLAKLSVEMTRLLGDDDNATFNPANLNGEKKQALVNLESLLIASSQIGDESVKASEAVEGIVLEKFRLLKVDYSNLMDERTWHDPSKANSSKTNATSSKSKMLKKPSINPEGIGTIQHGTPIKNISAALNALEVPGSETDGNSVSSPGSLISCSKSLSSTLLEGMRTDGSQSSSVSPHVRSCKIRNPPNYVAHSRPIRKSTGGVEDQQKSSGDTTDHETFCICKQKSHGWMIECDNDKCKIKWFHFNCVGIKKPPKGKWYCRHCLRSLKLGFMKSRDVSPQDMVGDSDSDKNQKSEDYLFE